MSKRRSGNRSSGRCRVIPLENVSREDIERYTGKHVLVEGYQAANSSDKPEQTEPYKDDKMGFLWDIAYLIQKLKLER